MPMGLIVGRILSALFVAGGWLLFGARLVLDLVGYSTAPDDIEVARTRMEQAFDLLLSAPWWAVFGFALVSTIVLIVVSWPQNKTESVRKALLSFPMAPSGVVPTTPDLPVPMQETGKRRLTAYDLESRQKAVDILHELNEAIRRGTLEKATYLAENFWVVANEQDITASLSEIIAHSEVEFQAYDQNLELYMRRFSDFDEQLRSSWNQYEFLDWTRQLKAEIFRLTDANALINLYEYLNNNKYYASWITARNQLADLVIDRRDKLDAQRRGYEKIEIISG